LLNLTECKTHNEVWEKIGRSLGYAELHNIGAIIHENEVVGFDIKLEGLTIKWRKPKK